MHRFILGSLLVCAMVVPATPAAAHCQIPCGIFDDELRVQLIEEHIGTIEKSMKQIVELSKADAPNHNQIVRWVMNKEEHAVKIQNIVTEYFMAQRIKLPADGADEAATKEYLHTLGLLHAIQVHAMKAKQGTDLGEIEQLRSLTKAFRKAYFGEEMGHTHSG